MIPIQFLHPRVLLFALPAVGGMAAVLYRGFKLRAQARRAYGREELIKRFSNPLTLRSEIPVMAGWVTVAFLLSLIMAMPVAPNNPWKIPAGSTQAVAVIDVSPSMAAEDHRDKFPPVNGVPPDQVPGPYGRRIDEVQTAIEKQLMPALAGNDLGIVLYEGEGYDQVDLDDNFQKIKWEFANNWLEIGQAPGDASDYGKGLQAALTTFANSPEPNKEKVIILFSDGGSDGLDRKALAETIEKVKAAKIKVIVVAVGSEKEMKVPDYNAQGVAKGYVQLKACDDKDSEGNCQTKLDMKELNTLASDFGTQPLLLDIGAKLPISWAHKIAGSKAENQPVHLFRFFLVPCLILVLLLETKALFSGRERA
jgi:von Willebrand factor type A domain